MKAVGRAWAVGLAKGMEPTATETCARDETGNLAGKRFTYKHYPELLALRSGTANPVHPLDNVQRRG